MACDIKAKVNEGKVDEKFHNTSIANIKEAREKLDEKIKEMKGKKEHIELRWW